MAAGDHVVVGAGRQVAAEIKRRPHPAAEGTSGFKHMPLFGRLHRFNPFDHDRRNDHDPHLQVAAPANGFEVLFLGVSFHALDLKLGVAAGGTRDLI